MACPKVKEIEKEWIIPSGGEFRFEVSFDEKIVARLLNGRAEIFGAEMTANREYELSGVKLAIYTVEGAKITIKGECEVEYISEETPMSAYMNAFFAVENLRLASAQKQDAPPNVLFIGESRHTVAKIFLNYSVRQGKVPVFVDLDCNKGSLLIPGVIAAQTIDKVVDIEEGFPEGQVCSYYFGHYSASENFKMYQKLLGRLAFAVNGRTASATNYSNGGAIIVAPSNVEPFLDCIQDLFKVNVIFVIGSERLHSTIARSLANHPSSLSILKLPLSGGAVQIDAAFRKSEFQRQVKSYFYGKRGEYTPFSSTKGFESISLYRLGESALAPSSALPLGASRKVSETRTVKVDPTQALLLYSIIAISWASTDEQLADINCAGYIYVTAVDDEKKSITFLSPSPGDLPSPHLIIVPWPARSIKMDLLVREKRGLFAFGYDYTGKRINSKMLVSQDLQPRQLKHSKTASLFAYSTVNEIIVMKLGENGESDQLYSKISVSAVDFSFSPSGSYMATFSRPSIPNLATGEPASTEPNLKIWKVTESLSTELMSFHHRHQNSWHIQWTDDETFFARQVLPNEVQFYRTEDSSKTAFKIREENLASFSVAPGAYPKVSIFIKESKGEPAAVKIFLLPNTSAPVASKYFFKADKIQFEWSPNGKNLLAISHTDVDSTGQSYYGENNLYYISGDGSFDCRVDLDKSGPVHDIAWGPKSDEFIVSYGYMPSKITLFNLKCEAAFEFPVESKNHIRYSPAGNLICFGGFGNLPGHIEIWTRSGTTLKKLAFIKAPSSSICEWSPSGHVLLTGTVTPRLRVDNGFILWTWTGEELEKVAIDEMYQASWNHCGPLAKFPLVDFSKSSKFNQSPVQQANGDVKKAAYRPPGLRDKASTLSETKQVQEKKSVVAIQKATISSGLSNREKNIRKLERKLEQIRDLKAKLADGVQLEINQLDKIKTELDLEEELQSIIAQPE